MDISKYIDKAKFYKTRVSSRYQSIDATRLTELIAKQEAYFVSKKYDGHLYFLCYENDEVVLLNAKGKQVTDLAVNKKALEILSKKDISQLMVAGELYVKDDEKRTRSFNLTTALTDKSDDIHYAVFDSIWVDNEVTYTKYVQEVIAELEDIFPTDGTVHCVTNEQVTSRKDIAQHFKNEVEINDSEGIVVKTDGNTYKIKPTYTFDAVIVGFADSDGERQGMFRDLLLAFMMPDESYQIIGHLHHGFSEDERKALLEEMSTQIVSSQYIEVARNKTAFHFIKPTKVIEFSCLDVICEDSKGAIAKMNLSYSDKDGYTINGKKNSVSMTIPNFVRFRTDKEVNPQDVRFDQVKDVVSFDEIDTVDEKDLAPSEIKRRAVYFKEIKENIAVRKFVLIKTNKENTNKYPAYVLHNTDFSAGRKDPLKKELMLTNSEQQAHQLFDESIEKNIKKGWVLKE